MLGKQAGSYRDSLSVADVTERIRVSSCAILNRRQLQPPLLQVIPLRNTVGVVIPSETEAIKSHGLKHTVRALSLTLTPGHFQQIVQNVLSDTGDLPPCPPVAQSGYFP